MDDVDAFSRNKFEDNCNPDEEINYMMEHAGLDDDWKILPAEAKELLRCPKKQKKQKIYNQYWRMYTRHCTRKGLDMFTEMSVIDYFLTIKAKFSKGTLCLYTVV